MYIQLADDLFVVGGGVINGFGLSTSADCHVYAFRSGDEILLVDCGMDDDGGLDAIFANMREAGLDPATISTVAITHYHVDHCGGIGRLLERVDAQSFNQPAPITADIAAAFADLMASDIDP